MDSRFFFFIFSCTCLTASILAYLYAAPYSKVEESFNTQAMHDMIFHGTDLDKYDHHEFPGVVPRTFLGSLSVATLAYPIRILLSIMDVPLAEQKFITGYACRSILGFLAIAAHVFMGLALGSNSIHALGTASYVGGLYLLLTASQFHSTFWATRALPNSFAFVITTFALAFYVIALRHRYGRSYREMIGLFCAAGVVFRSELILLAGPLFFYELIKGHLPPIHSLMKMCTIFFLISVSATIAVDSFFWRVPYIWPELDVLLFNTWRNQSHNWGTQPWHAYASHHLPKMLLLALPWALVSTVFPPNGNMNMRIARQLTCLALAFVTLYSFLPHKESRFIIYTLPLFNASAALVMHSSWCTFRGMYRRILSLLLISTIFGSFLLSVMMVWVSSHNYPGGEALRNLQMERQEYTSLVFKDEYRHEDSKPVVHVDVYTAQTGASRFLEHPYVVYNKTANLSLADRQDPSKFTARFVEYNAWMRETRRDRLLIEQAKYICVTCLTRVNIDGLLNAGLNLYSSSGSESTAPNALDSLWCNTI